MTYRLPDHNSLRASYKELDVRMGSIPWIASYRQGELAIDPLSAYLLANGFIDLAAMSSDAEDKATEMFGRCRVGGFMNNWWGEQPPMYEACDCADYAQGINAAAELILAIGKRPELSTE